jgi:hypothetical protein
MIRHADIDGWYAPAGERGMNGSWSLRGFKVRAQSFDPRAGVISVGKELGKIGRIRRDLGATGRNSIEGNGGVGQKCDFRPRIKNTNRDAQSSAL